MLEVLREEHAIWIPEVEYEIEQLNEFLSNVNNTLFNSLRAFDKKQLSEKLSTLELDSIVTKGNLIKLKRWLSLEQKKENLTEITYSKNNYKFHVDMGEFMGRWEKKLEILHNGLSFYDLTKTTKSYQKIPKVPVLINDSDNHPNTK